MRLLTVLLFAASLAVSARPAAQTVSLSGKNLPLEKVFADIEKQTGYVVFFNNAFLKNTKPVSLSVSNLPLKDFLSLLLRDQPFTFQIEGKTISLVPKASLGTSSFSLKNLLRLDRTFNLPDTTKKTIDISGVVSDARTGAPIPGVSVTVKNTKKGVATDGDGKYSIEVDRGTTLVFSFVGYVNKEVVVGVPAKINVQLEVSDQSMKDIVVTGIINKRKESFTGATATYKGEELRTIGNRNLLTSLRTLDPSFIIVENNLQGSNPNTLPSIELRGKTSVTTTDVNSQFNSDPNQPLFILDGFETTLDVINKLDINRVATVTILKDAASTAMYGSRAANGIVVVETKRPIAGELRLSYTGDFLLELPDLSSYNMMNAAEKLEFERLSGLYTAKNAGEQYAYDQMYNAKLAEIRRGVSTDWINIPVRNGFTNNHSVLVTGGNNELLFIAGLSYKNRSGVMKGSDQRVYSGNIDINYRKGKLNLMNMLYVSGSRGNESNYGSFADYVNANPYARMKYPDGSIPQFIDSSAPSNYSFNDPSLGSRGMGITEPVPNPLYNASFRGTNQSKGQLIQNNLRAILDIAPALRLQTGLQFSNNISTAVRFIPPENTAFAGRTIYDRGSYSNNRQDQTVYNGNMVLTYARIINKAHHLDANIRTEIRQESIRLLGLSATGFPDGTNGNPAFAYSYTAYSKPQSASQITRSNSFLGSISYDYKMRYLLDASYNLSGTNAFGSDNKFSSNWVIGLGWNLHREDFFRHIRWIDLLKVSGNIGLTGNQQLGVYTSTSVYSAVPQAYLFGSAINVTQLGNPALQWQSTEQRSAGLEMVVLDNQLSAQFNYYHKLTDPLVIGAESSFFPSSAGITAAYPINAGQLSVKGWEATLRFSPVYRKKEMIIWTIAINASANKSRFGKMANALSTWNKEQTQNRSIVRYTDGFSPDDIWAVRSLGIDPATGKELLQQKDGTITTAYDANDIIRIGNTRPRAQGVLSSVFTYKSFNMSINMRYSIGGYILNQALYSKVENISFQQIKYNQDKRALYDRWKQPGDLSQFRSIDITQYSPITSRFIQQENYLSGEAISIGWRFQYNS